MIALPASLFAEVREVGFLSGTVDLPVVSTLNVAALILALAAAVAVFRFKVGVLPVLAGCAVAGIVYRLAIG